MADTLPSPVTTPSNNNPHITTPPSQPTTEPTTEPNGPTLPHIITGPIEAILETLGSTTRNVTGWVSSRGQRATSRARPWLEFFDLSAFGLSSDGFQGHLQRLKINTPYFMFNYIIIGLIITILSVITHPIALIGCALLIWIYFQFFGVEHAHEDYQFLGFSLNDSEKLGAMVFLGAIVFWFTAGGFAIFFSILSAIGVVTVLHGSFRKPSADAIPPV